MKDQNAEHKNVGQK